MLKPVSGGITAPQGFVAAGVAAGIKKNGQTDVTIIRSVEPAVGAAVFTRNTMAAAPVIVSREHAADGDLAAIVVNSGCANACTGERGMDNARKMAEQAADCLGLTARQILVSSTGVIGVDLPMDKLSAGIAQAANALSADGGDAALSGIMTTDTFPKVMAGECQLGGRTVRLAGIAKGAGMIHPNMATMLCYLTTDAAISAPLLNKALCQVVELTFNMITVDGDTSTNDTLCILANGRAGNPLIESETDPLYGEFCQALEEVCRYLAQQVVRDGEGATKFLEITVQGARDFAAGKQAAMAVAKSPLVKTAFFGQDPNWGRILCAIGYSGIEAQPEQTSLWIGGLPIVRAGLPNAVDTEALRHIMAEKDIQIKVDLGQGLAEATVWTCDFSYEYVKINGEYTT